MVFEAWIALVEQDVVVVAIMIALFYVPQQTFDWSCIVTLLLDTDFQSRQKFSRI